ncbi:MAG TPA: hypothetical protein VF828_00995, partial [Patescibacteria group bacterium]
GVVLPVGCGLIVAGVGVGFIVVSGSVNGIVTLLTVIMASVGVGLFVVSVVGWLIIAVGVVA